MSALDDFLDALRDLGGMLEEKVVAPIADKLSGVERTLEAAVAKVGAFLEPKLAAVADTLDATKTAILGDLKDRITGIAATLDTSYGMVRDKIEGAVTDLSGTLSDVEETLTAGLSAGLSAVGDTVAAVEGKVTGAVSEGVSKAWEAGADILAKTAEFIKPALEAIGDTFKDLKDGVLALPEKVGASFMEAVSGGFVKLMGMMADDFIKASPTLSATLREAGTENPIMGELLGFTHANQGQLAGTLAMGMVSQTTGKGLGLLLDQAFAPTGWWAGRTFQNTRLSPAELIAAYYRFRENRPEFDRYLTDYGYDGKQREWLYGLGTALFGVSELGNLWLRGMIDDTELDRRLGELGWPLGEVDKIKALYLSIPPAQDLVRMAVREAFTPEIAEKFGQYEDIPDAFLTHARKVGLSEEWAKAYWAAHWELPSSSTGFEMLHRGIISRDELAMLLRALDVMPFWRDRLIQLSYVPFTRVDIRRMNKLGILDRAAVKRAYKDIGYDDDKAEALTLFTEKLNTAEAKTEATPDRDLTKTELVSLYRAGVMPADTLKPLLSRLGYDDTEVAYIVNLADYQEAKELQSLLLENIQLRFQKGVIEYNRASDELNALALPAKQVETLLLKWEKTRAISVKFPTRTELEKFVKYQLIGLEEYRTELVNSGYSQRWADMFVAARKVAGAYGTTE